MKPDQDVILKALTERYGIVSDAAKDLGISRGTLSRWIREDDELKDHLDECREILKDLTESRFIEHLKEGEEWAVRFSLQTLCKDRGYTQRIEQEMHGAGCPVVVHLPHNNRDELPCHVKEKGLADG
ncbi:MAG: hypothetical protein CMJ47_08765 [Planctomyces sp.]|nr:hypothetical protein [Planctomyces sp.]